MPTGNWRCLGRCSHNRCFIRELRGKSMHADKKPNDQLAYHIVPGQLRTLLHPAIWGNGQLELLANCIGPLSAK